MSRSNVSNERMVEMSFLEKLSQALKNDGSKVSVQYLCSAPRITLAKDDKAHKEQLAGAQA